MDNLASPPKVAMNPKLLILTMILAMLSLVASGCISQRELEPRNPFRSSSEYAEISGYSAGYMPGDSATFDITIKNPSEQDVNGEFCLLLLDREGVVATLIEKRPFSLAPSGSFTTREEVKFPSNLNEGAYGLAFMVPSQTSFVITVWLGEDTSQVVGFWPEVSSCP